MLVQELCLCLYDKIKNHCKCGGFILQKGNKPHPETYFKAYLDKAGIEGSILTSELGARNGPGNQPGLYYLHGDHLGTATFVTDYSGSTTQFFLNLPFGETMVEQRTGAFDNWYRFNAKELDKETNLYYYGARYYNPSLSIWYGVDPLAVYNPVMETEFYGDGQHNGGVFYWGNLNPYIYTYQNPIKYIDPNGKQTLGQQFGIAVRNPFKIGLMNNAGHTLANIAGEFSRRGATSSSPFAVLERNGPVGSDADRGGERGAFRHATWMTLISSEYSSKDAKWVGDLHEGKSTDISKTNNILGIMGADTVADELNNKIGREYGSKHKGTQARDIALGVLEIYNKEGLYQVENDNGANRFNVVRKKLSDDKYNSLKTRFENLSNDGVSPRPTKAETQNAQKKYIKNGTP